MANDNTPRWPDDPDRRFILTRHILSNVEIPNDALRVAALPGVRILVSPDWACPERAR